MRAETGSQRIAELDGWRALAVLSVVAFHYTLDTPLANPVTAAGWAGVDLFFVLSGYLITGILLDARSNADYFRRFYARRTVRILPVFYAILICLAVSARWLGGPQPWSYWAMQAAFLSSTACFFHYWAFPAPQYVYAGVTVLWSLSIEEQFYLLWAPVVRVLRSRALAGALLFVAVAAPCLRFLIHTAWYREYYFFPARLDSIAWGALLALALRRWPAVPALKWMGFVAAGLLVALAGITGFRRESLLFATAGYSLLAALFAALLGWTVLHASGKHAVCALLRWRPLQFVGRISYCVYLIHYPVLTIFSGWKLLGAGMAGTLARDTLSLAVTLGLAAMSWRWIEAPLLHRSAQTRHPALSDRSRSLVLSGTELSTEARSA